MASVRAQRATVYVIKPATAHVPDGERPIVWFSARQHWEPTASKGKIINGVRSTMTLREMISKGDGLWRFGVLVAELQSYHQLKKSAAIAPAMARALERSARECGADPAFWYGSLEAVKVSGCTIQCLYDPDGEWGGLPDRA